MDETGVARWTPPEAHENTVRALDANVPRIARSGLMNRLTVLDGNGNIHYDGTNPEQFVETWEGQFKRDLTDEERTAAHNRIELLEDLAYQYSPDSRTVFEMLDKLTKDVEFYSGGTPASFDGVKTTGSVYVKGTYPRRAACQRILEAQVKQLQALRKRSGLSQCELAERMGLSTARVSHIESSSPLDLKPDTLNRYVDALGLDLLIAVRTRDGKLIRLDEN